MIKNNETIENYENASITICSLIIQEIMAAKHFGHYKDEKINIILNYIDSLKDNIYSIWMQ